jgi:uroporphyrinogen-III synthase
MRILIISPAPETADLIASLAARGHEVIATPLITPERIESPEIKLEGAQGFLVTSADAVRALADAIAVRFFPLFAENAETANAAIAAGFSKVQVAKGDAASFARLIEDKVNAAAGALIHACHTNETNAVNGMLVNMGYAIRPLKLYTLKRAETLPRSLEAEIRTGTLDAAIVLSVDEARAFTTLIQRA